MKKVICNNMFKLKILLLVFLVNYSNFFSNNQITPVLTNIFEVIEYYKQDVTLDISKAALEKFRNDINAIGENGISPLVVAVQTKNQALVTWLLENGANVNAISSKSLERSTALHTAVYNTWDDNIEIISILLKYGADINAKDKNGTTPLCLATNVVVANLLIKYGADINFTNDYGWTPLHFAASKHYASGVAECLLQYGAKTEVAGDDGIYPLHLASKYCLKSVLYLVNHGANVNVADKFGVTPLHEAANQYYPDSVDYLIKHNANVNAVDRTGKTPLHNAKTLAIARKLIWHGAKPVALFTSKVLNNTFMDVMVGIAAITHKLRLT